jgi:hypothetical protein
MPDAGSVTPEALHLFYTWLVTHRDFTEGRIAAEYFVRQGCIASSITSKLPELQVFSGHRAQFTGQAFFMAQQGGTRKTEALKLAALPDAERRLCCENLRHHTNGVGVQNPNPQQKPLDFIGEYTRFYAEYRRDPRAVKRELGMGVKFDRFDKNAFTKLHTTTDPAFRKATCGSRPEPEPSLEHFSLENILRADIVGTPEHSSLENILRADIVGIPGLHAVAPSRTASRNAVLHELDRRSHQPAHPNSIHVNGRRIPIRWELKNGLWV